MAKNQSKQPEKKEGVISKAAHAIAEAIHPHQAEQKQVGEILESVESELEQNPAQAMKAVKSNKPKADKALEQHPKFAKFKKGDN